MFYKDTYDIVSLTGCSSDITSMSTAVQTLPPKSISISSQTEGIIYNKSEISKHAHLLCFVHPV